MSFETVANTIRSTFKTQIADAQSISTGYDNAPYDRPENTKHVLLSIVPGESVQVSLGATKRFRHPGIMSAAILVPLEVGDKDALEIADFIDLAFRATTFTVSGQAVHFRTPAIQRVGRDGKWWRVNVNVPYYADTIG